MIRMMLAVLVRMMLVVIALAAGPGVQASALQPPEGRKIRVAVVMTENAVVIDYAGPWEVFANVHTGTGDMAQQMPFELYTVGRDRQPIHTSGGGMKPGMTVVPDYAFADAPAPDVVVIGAQTQAGPADDTARLPRPRDDLAGHVPPGVSEAEARDAGGPA